MRESKKSFHIIKKLLIMEDYVCVICFDEMDMKSYSDEHESTSTCFKLRCGHAFHTKCIVECLQKSNHECPNCHGNKNLEAELSREGVVIRLVKEIKKESNVKAALKEYNLAKGELCSTNKQLKKETLEFAKTRKQTLEYDKKHKYFLQTISKVKSEIKAAAKQKGPKFEAFFGPRMYNHMTSCKFERLVLNAYGYSYHRLKYKHNYIKI